MVKKKNLSNVGAIYDFDPTQQKWGLMLNVNVHAGDAHSVGDLDPEIVDINRIGVKDVYNTIVVNLIGNSMIGAGLNDGDILYMDKTKEPQNGDIVCVRINGDHMVKRFYKKLDTILLVPANEGYPIIKVDETMEFAIEGVMFQSIRPTKKDSCTVTELEKYLKDHATEYGELLKAPIVDNFVTFNTCITGKKSKTETLAKLHELIDGKKGKEVALVIRAAMEVGLITKPRYAQVAKEFGNIGVESGFNRYMNVEHYEYEIAVLKQILEN